MVLLAIAIGEIILEAAGRNGEAVSARERLRLGGPQQEGARGLGGQLSRDTGIHGPLQRRAEPEQLDERLEGHRVRLQKRHGGSRRW